MAPVIALISDLVATAAGVLAIWLGIKVLRDGKSENTKNDDRSEEEHWDTSDRDGRDDPDQ